MIDKTVLRERIADRYEIMESGCWIWIGSRMPAGYGKLGIGGDHLYAHRVSYIVHVGDIPSGYEIHHTCNVHACIAPAHLRLVTIAEHKRLHTEQRTHCIWGHEFVDANTYVRPDGRRRCKACHRRRVNESNATLRGE